MEKAAKRAETKKVGDPFTDVEQGPQVDKDQMNKVGVALGLVDTLRCLVPCMRDPALGFQSSPFPRPAAPRSWVTSPAARSRARA